MKLNDQNNKETIEFLSEHIHCRGYAKEDRRLAAKDVMKRAAVAESPGDPDCLILEIRSRRPYYDSVDQVPISLSAFVGWRVCYEYIRTDDELWEPAPPELEVNYPALASAWLIGSRFSCVNLGCCEVEIREESSHRREVVCSAQRAERFGRSLPLAWNFQSLQVDLEGCVSPTKLGEIIATLRNECCDLAGALAREAFEKCRTGKDA